MKYLYVSDFTLKSIEKEGRTLTFREKLSLCEKLDELKLDAIELPELKGNKENEIICRTIASSLKNSSVKILVGDSIQSIDNAFNTVKNAKSFGLVVALPVSTALMEYGYHLKANKMLDKIKELVSYASKLNNYVEFVAIDAFRAEDGFIEKCASVAYESGAKYFTLSDDNGTALPSDFVSVINKVKSVCNIKVGVSPSNSLSLSVAIVLDSINAGVDYVKTTAIGDGFSVGALSNLVKLKGFDLGVKVNLDGCNALNVVSVINGEINAECSSSDNNVKSLNSNSTIKDLLEVSRCLGYELSDEDLGKVFEEIKKLTSKKESIDVKEIEAVIASTAMQVPSTYHLINFVVNASNVISATANITLEKDGERFTGVSNGDGPIDAAFHAIEQIVGHHYELDDFQVQAVTKGRGAVGSSIIRLRANGKLYPGNGVSTDIIGACIRAYINALNKIVYEGE